MSGDAPRRNAAVVVAVQIPQRATPAPRAEGAQPVSDDDREVRLAAALSMIERQFRRRGLSFAEIAKAAHFRAFHFHRLFCRRYGKTPKQLIEELRIAEIQRLMLRGVSPRHAEAATGFAHQSHMTTRFKRRIGATPWKRLAAQS